MKIYFPIFAHRFASYSAPTDRTVLFLPQVEKKCWVRRTLSTAARGSLPLPPADACAPFNAPDAGTSFLRMPALPDLGHGPIQLADGTTAATGASAAPQDERGVFGSVGFRGGETAALARLKHYLWDTDCLSTYFDTRNGKRYAVRGVKGCE